MKEKRRNGKKTSKYPNGIAGIRDIAERANVSLMTVSRALRNVQYVSSETRDRIFKISRAMGYVPNRIASNLVQNRTRTIGIVVPELARFYPPVIAAMDEVFSPAGYQQFVCCSNHSPEKELREVTALLERRVDGLALVPTSVLKSRDTLDLIEKNGCPVVVFDRLIPGSNVDDVSFDDYRASYDVVNYMIKKGCRVIAFIGAQIDNYVSIERERGYKDALTNGNLIVPRDFVVHTSATVAGGREGALRIFEDSRAPDGILCVNDLSAIGVHAVISSQHRKIGRMKVIGFGSVSDTDLVSVANLTMVLQDTNEAGKKIGEILLARIEKSGDSKMDPIHVVLKPSFHPSD